MEVLSKRSALLSNYEVLALLKELESEQLARQKTAIRIKKEEEERLASGEATVPSTDLASLLVQDEPTQQQSAESITRLVRDLNKFDLTKAEKLQIVNLAPTEPVELYVIVEEIEDRLGSSMEEVLDVVRSSLAESEPLFLPTEGDVSPSRAKDISLQDSEGREVRPGWNQGEANGEQFEDEFDDLGAGAGVEGDLEMGDENED